MFKPSRTSPFRIVVLVSITLINTCICAYGQTISGKITTTDANPIPFASIYVKEASMGTTANVDGQYELTLKDEGSYEITYQAMGFEKQTLRFSFNDKKTLVHDVVLKPQTFQLREVRVYSGNEDPAVPIMRKAIALAPYHLKQVDAYNSEVYLKGSLLMKKIPALLAKRFIINGQAPVEGKRYTAESLNAIDFTQPDKYTHKIISSRSTFPQSDNENNPISYITASLYQPSFDELISPFSPQAFNHYKFRYEGFFDEGALTVNKIKVIPKRKSPQLFSGYLYVTEGLWSLHSADLTNEAFWGKVRIKQVYTPVEENIWLPATHLFDVDASIMGIKAEFSYAGSVKYLKVSPNTKLATPSLVKLPVKLVDEPTPPVLTKSQKKIEEISSKDNLTQADMAQMMRLMAKEERKKAPKDTSMQIVNNYKVTFAKDTVKRDSLFWSAMRPIPLTPDEVQSFHVKDSLALAKLVADTAKVDSTAKKGAGIFGKSLGGYNYSSKDTTFKFRYDGLLGFNKFGFNPVDGFWFKQTASITFRMNATDELKLVPMVKYAFGREALLGSLRATRSHTPMKRGLVWFTASANSEDFSPVGTTVLANTGSNLFFKTNHINQFQNNTVRLGQKIDLANGLQLSIELGYSHFMELSNSTDFSFIDPDKPYPENKPSNAIGDLQPFVASQNEWSTLVKLRYTPKFKYRIDKGQKIMVYSNWPTFEGGWHQAYSALGSNTRFSHLWLTVTQKQNIDPLSFINYTFSAGKFLNADAMHFSSFKAFANVSPDIDFKPLSQRFALLHNYHYNTNQQYAELHFNYSSALLVMKRLPFFSNRWWNENLYFHGLSTPQLPNHLEVGYGISQIFFAGEVGVVAAFEKFDYTGWAVKVSWGF
jgi:hypothetical protein